MTDYLISDILVTEIPEVGKVTADLKLSNFVWAEDNVACDSEIIFNANGEITELAGEGVTIAGDGGGGSETFVLSELHVQNTGSQQRTLNLPVYYPDQNTFWTTISINGGVSTTYNLVIPADGKLTARVSSSYTITGDAQRIGGDYVEFTPGIVTITVS